MCVMFSGGAAQHGHTRGTGGGHDNHWESSSRGSTPYIDAEGYGAHVGKGPQGLQHGTQRLVCKRLLYIFVSIVTFRFVSVAATCHAVMHVVYVLLGLS